MTPEPNPMPKIPYTVRHKSGVYKVNVRVPKSLRDAGAYGGKAKIVESLETKEYRSAARLAPERVADIMSDFATLEKRLSETGCIQGDELNSTSTRSRRKQRGEQITGQESECCFRGSRRGAESFAEQLARTMFVELLKASEGDIEAFHTRGDYDGLEELLLDAGRGLEDHTTSASETTPAISGRNVLIRRLRSMSLPFTKEGLEKVETVHDKFRRAIVEVEKRSLSRIEELLEARKNGKQAGVGWKDRFDGFFADLDVHTRLHEELQPVSNVASTQEGQSKGMTLAELCSCYLRKQMDVGVAPKTLRDVEASVKHVQAALGYDFPVRKIGVNEAKMVVNFLSRLPKGMRLEGSPEEVRQRVEAAKSATGFTPMSERTFEKKCTMIQSIIAFAVSDYSEELARNPFATASVKASIKQASPAGDGRDVVPYTVGQLNELFHQPLYTGHQQGRSGWSREGEILGRDSGRYWAPLLMLYHGCRLNEVAQLMVDDVDVDGDIPYFRVSEYQGVKGQVKTPKRLKNRASERLVPIHRQLIRCGFLDYVRLRRSKKDLWLFPEWTHETIKQWRPGETIPSNASKHSDLASDHCLKLRDRILHGDEEAKPCNHSFRHMVRTSLREAGVDNKIAEVLLGWSDGNKTMGDHYGETPLRLLSDAVNKIQYDGLDIAHLYPAQPSRRRRRRG